MERTFCLKVNEDNLDYPLLPLSGVLEEIINLEDLQAVQSVVDELSAAGLLQDSQGAKVVDLSDHNLGVCLITKKDGTCLYARRDLAAADSDKARRKNSGNQDLQHIDTCGCHNEYQQVGNHRVPRRVDCGGSVGDALLG